ncbi:MAG: phenylalanine--tRNA ligase beta subunit-related protein [Bacteroidota bacterium]
MTLSVDPHPLLHLAAFETTLAAPLGETPPPDWLTALLALDAEAPVQRSETIRATSRNLLRHGGYKPTGRGKPASEYLVRAAENGKLGSINAVVDACNVVSLHSGLPISVVDLDGAAAPFRVGLAENGASYVFNTSGQSIDLSGLLCLFDSGGPCANGVKDSQRTKTHDGTRRTLSLVWGHHELADQVEAATAWYRSLLERLGATTEAVTQG